MIMSTNRSRDWYKRPFDLVFVVVTHLLLFPFLVVFWAMLSFAIWIEDRGPVFYTQLRVGKNNKEFKLVKFRTMSVNAEQLTGPVWASVEDSRVTRVGKLLRRYRIDEMPQVLNIVKGDMSIVGPRPERPFFVTQLSEKIPYYNLRHKMKGGITGWAQINQGYASGEKESETKLEYDLYYIKWMGFTIDVLVILRTLFVLSKGLGAK